MAALAARYRVRGWNSQISVSPLLEIDEECRVVMLDQDPQLCYRKVRSAVSDGHNPPEWRHNLRLGAIAVPIDDDDIGDTRTTLARRAMEALGLRFAAVDLVSVAGSWRVLEVSTLVKLERSSQQGPSLFDRAAHVYAAALRRCFSGDR